MNYTSGVFDDKTGDLTTTHAISIVGWGEENGTPYWLVRNSWGTYWGINGFFKVIRGVNNIAIESKCSWGTPKDTWTNKEVHKTTQAEKTDPKN
jgi:cathepsin X